MRVYSAEFVGTFWLVLGGCVSAVLAAAFPGVGIGAAVYRFMPAKNAPRRRARV
jgi:glycerol uptake facilitator-like aquaporin